MLAITNAIKADVLDKETLAANFMLRLRDMYPEALTARYKFEPDPEMNGFELLEEAAKNADFWYQKANMILSEWQTLCWASITTESSAE